MARSRVMEGTYTYVPQSPKILILGSVLTASIMYVDPLAAKQQPSEGPLVERLGLQRQQQRPGKFASSPARIHTGTQYSTLYVYVYSVQVYIAPTSSNGAGPVWTKLFSDSNENGLWAVDKLILAHGQHSVTIPDIPAGDYLLRAEIAALHEANVAYTSNPIRGVQMYMSCSQIRVTSNGTEVPPGGTSFPGTYTSSTPGIVWNLYDPLVTPLRTRLLGPLCGRRGWGSVAQVGILCQWNIEYATRDLLGIVLTRSRLARRSRRPSLIPLLTSYAVKDNPSSHDLIPSSSHIMRHPRRPSPIMLGSALSTPSTRTERSTLYFDAPSSSLSSPDDSRDLRDPMANTMDNMNTQNDGYGGGGGGGMILPTAPGSVLPAAGNGKQRAVHEEEDALGEGGNGMHGYGGGGDVKDPFSSQQTEAESLGWLPAVDNNYNHDYDQNNLNSNYTNGGGNAHMNGSGVGGGQTNGGPVNRSNSVSPAQRPPVPARPNSFVMNGNNPNSRLSKNGNGNGTGGTRPNSNGNILDGGYILLNQRKTRHTTHERMSADAALTPKQQSQIAKVQRSESKRLSKILKKESKVEKQTLAVKMSELEELIKLQKDAVKKESTSFHTLRQKFEAAQARLASSEQNVDNARKYLEEAQEGVRNMEEKVREKRMEVEGFKEERNVGEKERVVKMGALSGNAPAQGMGSPLRNGTAEQMGQSQAPPMKDVSTPGRKSGRKLGIWK
ncbi:glycoside hydrolase family protein [Salix suchowensis]|nr:glycoside hydrolase family protein [Salix suchowensis]